MKILSEVGPSK